MKNFFRSFCLVSTVLMLNVAPALALQINGSSDADTASAPPPDQTVPQPDQTQFAKVIDDLPLMPGLTVKTDNDVLFIVPSTGRIAETVAEGSVDVDEVYLFYQRTLPQLGWKMVNPRIYAREGERLFIDAKAHNATTTVHFEVKPDQPAENPEPKTE